MSIKELINEQNKIDGEVKAIAKQMGLKACYDGVISPEHYSMAPIKTSWVFREPHDEDGDYDYKTSIVDRLKRNDIGRDKYFDPMRYLEYSLKKGLVLYDDIPYSDKDIVVSKLLLQTAFTNINKIPGGPSVNWNTFWDYTDKFNDLVKRQLAMADPKIIIASGTIEFFKRCGYLRNASVHKKSYRDYYVSEDKKTIILDCYHLGQRRMSQENLCNDIIKALQNAKENGFLN